MAEKSLLDVITPDMIVVFDLDDTLYKEIDFVDSGFRHVLRELGLDESLVQQMRDWLVDGQSVFGELAKASMQAADVGESRLVELYRNHMPEIKLDTGTRKTLDYLKKSQPGVALITDGRSVTQRNKIEALGLNGYFDIIQISEETGFTKPHPHNFEQIVAYFGSDSLYCYVADNPKKDFIAPSELGWLSVMLKDDGRNVHSQVPGIQRSMVQIVHI